MEVWTLAQAAEYCGVTPQTISAWIKSGRLKAAYTGAQKKRARFVLRKDVEAFFNEGV